MSGRPPEQVGSSDQLTGGSAFPVCPNAGGLAPPTCPRAARREGARKCSALLENYKLAFTQEYKLDDDDDEDVIGMNKRGVNSS